MYVSHIGIVVKLQNAYTINVFVVYSPPWTVYADLEHFLDLLANIEGIYNDNAILRERKSLLIKT